MAEPTLPSREAACGHRQAVQLEGEEPLPKPLEDEAAAWAAQEAVWWDSQAGEAPRTSKFPKAGALRRGLQAWPERSVGSCLLVCDGQPGLGSIQLSDHLTG